MSGHSKWATIKRKKGAADAKRGATFTKYANAIAVAAREGIDPETNYKLRLAIDKARSINMPTANIQRAVDRGSGKSQEKRPEDVTYEGYGPGGVALMVNCATDNTNRTLAEVKSTITKQGGRLAEPGAVTYQFKQKGVIVVTGGELEEASLLAIDEGAEDIEAEDNMLTVYTPPKQLMAVKQALEQAGHTIESAELSFEPTQRLQVSDKNTAAKVLKLVESLEDLDDVVAVYSNFDIPETLLEELA